MMFGQLRMGNDIAIIARKNIRLGGLKKNEIQTPKFHKNRGYQNQQIPNQLGHQS